MRGFFIFEGTPSFLKKYQKGTPSFLIAVPQPQVILERPYKEGYKEECNNRITRLRNMKSVVE